MALHASEWANLIEKNSIDSDLERFVSEANRAVDENTTKSSSVGGHEIDETAVDMDYVQRKVHCSLCAKRFWSLQDLRRHMRSHTGERPFECSQCRKRFTLKHSMMRHQRRHIVASCASGSEDEMTVVTKEPTTGKEDQTYTSHIQQQTAPSINSELVSVVKQEIDNGSQTRNVLHSLLARPNKNTVTKLRTKLSMITSKPRTITRNGHSTDLTSTSSLLPKLLGVENSTIDKMLDSVDSAITLLGVK